MLRSIILYGRPSRLNAIARIGSDIEPSRDPIGMTRVTLTSTDCTLEANIACVGHCVASCHLIVLEIKRIAHNAI